MPLICAQSQILTFACHPGNPILLLLLVSVVDFVFVFGFLLRLSPAASSSPSSSPLPSSDFIWFRPASRDFSFSLCLVSSREHSRLQSHECCLRLCHRVALRHPLFHTILFVHVSVVGAMSLVRCTCASWHKKPGGRVPAVWVWFLTRDTPKCRAAWPPLFEVGRPRLTKCGPRWALAVPAQYNSTP